LNADWTDEMVVRAFWLKPDSMGYAQLWYCLTHSVLVYPSLIRAFRAKSGSSALVVHQLPPLSQLRSLCTDTLKTTKWTPSDMNCAKCGTEIPAGQEVKKGFLMKKSYHKGCAG